MIPLLYKKFTGLQTKDFVLKGILDGSRAFIGPEVVQLDVTNRCNNDCICCWNNSPLLGTQSQAIKKEKEYELPLKLLKEVIKELKRMGTKRLFLAGGGEPFMHPDIMEILKFAKGCKMKIFINTNFTLIDEKMAEAIVDLKIDLIHVSLLAGTAKTYALVHPNKTERAFHKIKDTLKYLISQRNKKGQDSPVPFPHIDLYCVVFNENHQDIRDMVSLAMELRVNSLEFTPIDVISGKTDVLLLNDSQRKQVLEEVKSQRERLEEFNKSEGGKVVFIEQYDSFIDRLSANRAMLGEYEDKTVTRYPCYVGWSFARILANGDVNPCLKAHRISIGNIYKQSFGDIWNSQKQRLFRKKSFKLDREDKYFEMIGNDPASEFGCLKSCDNIQINMDMHNKYRDILGKYGRIK